MLDTLHFPRGASRFAASFFPSGFARGFSEATRLYGLVVSHFDVRWVNGHFYAAVRRAPPLDGGPPPASREALEEVLLASDALRQRLSAADRAIAGRTWLSDLALWDDEVKPAAIRENRALQRVDPSRATDEELARHVVDARHNAETAIYRHGRFTMTAGLPVGDFLVHASEWTGQPYDVLLRAVKGYSPVSVGVAAAELGRLAATLAAQPGRVPLDEGDPAATLAALAADPGAIGAAARAWLDEVSYRMVTGYDVTDRFGLELPGSLLATLRAVMAAPAPRAEASAEVEQATAGLRDQVPDAHRSAFDALLSDARAVYRLRDERNHANDGWATGLMRRALLEAGARLARAGRVSEPEHVLDASCEEVLALLRGEPAPSRDELDARLARRRDAAAPPPMLGPPPSPPPSPGWFAPGPARMERAAQAFLFGAPPAPDSTDVGVLRGIPVSGGVHEGPARVVLTAEDFASVRQGDVLVTVSTSPHFNVLLPLLGALVTDRGGALCHAAIVAREYGIPCVVGTKDASRRLQTGQIVRVDGNAGEVRRGPA